MRKWKFIVFSIIFSTLLQVCVVSARTWTASSGKSIEAEFVSINGNKVALKLKSGKTIRVPIKGLTQADQEFLKTLIPPRIRLDVKYKRTREVLKKDSYDSWKWVETHTKVLLSLRKVNQEPYSKQLLLHVCVIARNPNSRDRVVIEQGEYPFSFDQSRVFDVSIPTPGLRSVEGNSDHSLSSYYYSRNLRFEGILVWVGDRNGKRIFLASDPSGRYDKAFDKLKLAEKRTVMDKDFDPIHRKTFLYY